MKEDSMPICRSIQKHWIYKDAEYFKIWFEMLANARYSYDPKTDMYQGIIYTLNRGEFIFGRISWSDRLNIGQQKIRTFIKKLIKENMISEVSRTSKFTIYLITNYANFNQQDNQQNNEENQGVTPHDNQQNNQQATTKQPASNQQVTTKEESKEGCKKEKNKPSKIAYAEFVHMLEGEYTKLVIEYGESNVKTMITKLDNYKGAKGKTYKSDYRAILTWVAGEVMKTKDITPASYKVVNEGCCHTCKGKGVVRQENEWVECPECKGGKKVG